MSRSLLALTGSVCTALSLELWYIPHDLMDGGMTGVAVLLGRTLHLQPVYLLIPLNALCVVAGAERLGQRYVRTTAIGLFVYGLILRLIAPLPAFFSLRASIILGGAGVGLGIGLLLRAGGALDGLEALGLLIQNRLGVSVVVVLVGANLILFGLATWLWGLWITLPSLAAQIICQLVIAWVMRTGQ